jgi:hypothetical protein
MNPLSRLSKLVFKPRSGLKEALEAPTWRLGPNPTPREKARAFTELLRQDVQTLLVEHRHVFGINPDDRDGAISLRAKS